MSAVDTTETGEFGLAGLACRDLAAAVRFYADLLGWHARIVTHAGLTLMGKPDAKLAVLYSQTPHARAAGVLPHWTPFIAVSNATAAQASAAALGGVALRAPFDAAGMGRIAPIRDPVGATVSLWEPSPSADVLQAGAHTPHCPQELLTDDLARARRFYADLLGWRLRADGDRSATIIISGRAVGAMREANSTEVGAPGWVPSLPVEDLNRSARKANRLGAARLEELASAGSGFFQDPQGAVFSLFEEARPR